MIVTAKSHLTVKIELGDNEARELVSDMDHLSFGESYPALQELKMALKQLLSPKKKKTTTYHGLA